MYIIQNIYPAKRQSENVFNVYSFRLMSLCWLGIESQVMCEVYLTVQIVKGVLVRKRRYFVNIEGTPTMTLMFTLEF